MSERTQIILQEYGGKLCIRRRQPNSPEFQVSLLEVPALVIAIIKAVPRDAYGAALIEQIIATARAQRQRDRTNAERQRRFRERRARKTVSGLESITTGKAEKTSS
jgi:hypothetical protein